MDKCREDFEQSPKTKELLSDSIYFDEKENRYKVNADGCLISVVFLNGRWEVWQEQQAKVEELQKQLNEYIFVAETLDEMYVKEVKSSDELQKRVDAVTHLIRGLRAEFDLWMDVECPQVERQIELLEQALKGEG